MIFLDLDYEDFLQRINSKRIVLFGVSTGWRYYMNCFDGLKENVFPRVSYVVDNSSEKQGTKCTVEEFSFDVFSPDKIRTETECIILIVVNMAFQQNICEQLKGFKLPNSVECYSLPLMAYDEKQADNSCVDEYFKNKTEKKIPAKIHSFWFSGEEKPDLYKKCIESWHKCCPDFEICEWNTENYDITKNAYMQEAYDRRKWAFVSDYARLDIIHTYGGIYMDMDVELTTSLDFLLYADSFFYRQEDGFLELGSGFGAPKGDSLIKEMLETYYGRHLILPSGEIDNTPQPEWIKGILSEKGITKNTDSQVINGRLIMSNDYITCFTGGNPNEKAKLGIHWHNGGWLDEAERQRMRDAFAAKEVLRELYFR